ncbi:formimidoylglutamase [soil metagenome]
MYDLYEFLHPVNISALHNDSGYNDMQFGSRISVYEDELPDLEECDIVILGVGEQRGAGLSLSSGAADSIRKQLYALHNWHTEIKIADIGTVKTGATLSDSYAAIKTVLAELLRMKKTVVLLGGSHDITLAQYFAYKELKQIIDATVIDATIDLNHDSMMRSENFLMEMLTSEPNHVKHYNHIGFQSYFVHPRMLETMDKLRFDCYRVGTAKETIEEMEPVIRSTNMLSFDIAAIKNSDAPANTLSPNGFTGEEACMLTRFAGMSTNLSTFGIYGYQPEKDRENLTAVQIAQMIWYFIDGKNRSLHESAFDDKHNFNEFHIGFSEIDTTFLQSKKTGRWWMQLPDAKLVPCSYNDYVTAGNNQIPERWLRAQERD